MTAGPVRDEQGTIFGGVVVAVDVTRQKRAVEEVRQREARFRSAIDAVLDSFCVMEAVRNEAGAVADFVFHPTKTVTVDHCPAEVLAHLPKQAMPDGARRAAKVETAVGGHRSLRVARA